MKARIAVAGLNPAWQKTLFFGEFRPFEVNRAEEIRECASGKGINFARAARIFGTADCCVFQFAGAENGKKLLQSMRMEGIDEDSTPIKAATRCCNTVLCAASGRMTELIEPSPLVSAEESEEFLRRFDSALSAAESEEEAFGAFALCGTAPRGIPPKMLPRLTELAAAHGCLILLDAVSGIDECLKQRVDLLKINKEELFRLSGASELKTAVRTLFDRCPGIKNIGITDAAGSACFSDRRKLWKIAVPRLQKTLNSLGSGDTCSAVALSELLNGKSPLDAFRMGLAAASANCLNAAPACYDKKTALDLFAFTEYITVSDF